MMLEVSQEDAAVLSAIRQVRESTGFGKVTVEIKDGHVRFIEISSTVLIKRNSDKIEEKWAHDTEVLWTWERMLAMTYVYHGGFWVISLN